MQIRINEQTDAGHRWPRSEYPLEKVLADVRAATSDWRQMRARAEEILAGLDTAPPSLPADEVAEAKAFLSWLNDDHFTYLGYREYDFSAMTTPPRSRSRRRPASASCATTAVFGVRRPAQFRAAAAGRAAVPRASRACS